MGGQELIECLEHTGTGRDKLRHAKNLVHERPQATGEDVLHALEKAGARSDGGPNQFEGTLSKARKLLTGNREAVLKELAGTPPKSSKEAQDNRFAALFAEKTAELVERVSERIHERQAEAQALGVGRPMTRPGK